MENVILCPEILTAKEKHIRFEIIDFTVALYYIHTYIELHDLPQLHRYELYVIHTFTHLYMIYICIASLLNQFNLCVRRDEGKMGGCGEDVGGCDVIV